jgi:hypothetical protein
MFFQVFCANPRMIIVIVLTAATTIKKAAPTRHATGGLTKEGRSHETVL